jgi:hypothetical protein
MRDALRRAFEAVEGDGPLGRALLKAEAVEGAAVRRRSRNEAFEELLGRLREHADATGVALPPVILDGLTVLDPLEEGDAETEEDWHKVVFVYTRELLRWPVIDWLGRDLGISWQTAATVQAAADRAEREVRPGRPRAELIAEAWRLPSAVFAWNHNPTRVCTDELERLHDAVTTRLMTAPNKEFPFAVYADYIAAVRRHVRD